MPELPEVETVIKTLEKNIKSKKIVDVIVYYEKIIRNLSVSEFKKKLIGQSFREFYRRGKYLIFQLDDYILVSHLRMEGKYNLMSVDSKHLKHEHIVFTLDNGKSLRYDDVRKFGTMDLFPKINLTELYKIEPLNRIAPDIYSVDFDQNFVIEKLNKTTKPIKSALLDQSIISGVGNIYVDEVLFRSKIHPMSRSNTLDNNKLIEVIQNIKIVLDRAIALGGTTIKSFTSSHSISGRFQNELLVHTKEVCPICNAKLTKIKVGGRTSYVCLVCQKMIDKKE